MPGSGNDAAHFRAADGCQPAEESPCGVGNQNSLAHALEEGAQGVEFFFHIVRADIRRHLAEKLVQGILVRRELYSRVECRPFADPEDVKPELLVGKRLDGGFRRRSARPAPPGEVNQADGVSLRRKMLLKPSRPSGVVCQHRADCP